MTLCDHRAQITQIDMEIENEISYKIRGAIFNVYNKLSPGLLESAYEIAFMQEVFFSQLMTYLKLTGKKLGILVNFKTTDIAKSIYRRANNL